MEEPEELKNIEKRRDVAFNIALEKLLETNGKLESVMQTGEAFGRGLFTDYIKENTNDWTIEKWFDSTMENILNPLGNKFESLKISEDEVQSMMSICPLQQNTNEPQVASLFTYSFMRGMLKSAFPKGEVLMEKSLQKNGEQKTQFIFKSNARPKDRFERERVKDFFNITKKL
jgi:hypothetical protein